MRPYGQMKRGKIAAWFDGMHREHVEKARERRSARVDAESEADEHPLPEAIPPIDCGRKVWAVE